MELRAACMAFRALKYPCKVKLISDSQYLVESMRGGRALGWKRAGWLNRGYEVKNADLWRMLLGQSEPHEVTWEWVRGHSGIDGNEAVDKSAGERAKKAGELSRAGLFGSEDCLIDELYEKINQFEVKV
jgi:ribonuclease HI